MEVTKKNDDGCFSDKEREPEVPEPEVQDPLEVNWKCHLNEKFTGSKLNVHQNFEESIGKANFSEQAEDEVRCSGQDPCGEPGCLYGNSGDNGDSPKHCELDSNHERNNETNEEHVTWFQFRHTAEFVDGAKKLKMKEDNTSGKEEDVDYWIEQAISIANSKDKGVEDFQALWDKAKNSTTVGNGVGRVERAGEESLGVSKEKESGCFSWGSDGLEDVEVVDKEVDAVALFFTESVNELIKGYTFKDFGKRESLREEQRYFSMLNSCALRVRKWDVITKKSAEKKIRFLRREQLRNMVELWDDAENFVWGDLTRWRKWRNKSKK